ncbi:glycosyltransferase family 4 protein [Glycomyces halotolerans]
MKIVVAHNRYSSAQPSGENTIVDYEIGALSEAGVSVVPFLRSSDEIGSLPVHRKAALAVSPVHAAGTQRELAALLEVERPDVLHLHNPYPLLSPSVVTTAHRAGVKVVQTIHNYRHDCVNGLYFRDGHDCRDCHGRRWNGPGVLHGCYRGSRAQSAVMAVALGVHQPTWRSVDRFIALTDPMADYLRSIGIDADRIRVKPNAVADPLEGGAGLSDAGEGFLFAARLVPEKGVELLLEAWRQARLGVPLRIAGDGPLRPLVESAAGADGIEYLGQLAPQERDAALGRSAAAVIPSVWQDILPTSGIEALATGRAVVATRMGGAPFIVGDGTEAPAGVAVEPNPKALAAGLELVAGRAGSYAANARARYESVFSPEVVLKRLLGVYEELLD